jgi:hypothetical protein
MCRADLTDSALLSRVASLARAYLLVMASISSDDLGFFIMSLRISTESLRPFLKNMVIDLSSTSRMTFLLLQKHWMNSRSDSPSFYMMPARSHSTLGLSQVALKLLMNWWQRSDQDRTDPIGSPINQVLADEDKQIGK